MKFTTGIKVAALGWMLALGSADATTIKVVFNNGAQAEGLTEAQARQRTQLGAWMAPDIVRVFARYAKQGFKAELLPEGETFTAAEGVYRLDVTITEYNAGSKAARIIVGFGAGGVSLNTDYALYGAGSEPLLSSKEGVFSGREWQNAARKVNENIAKAVTEKLK